MGYEDYEDRLWEERRQRRDRRRNIVTAVVVLAGVALMSFIVWRFAYVPAQETREAIARMNRTSDDAVVTNVVSENYGGRRRYAFGQTKMAYAYDVRYVDANGEEHEGRSRVVTYDEQTHEAGDAVTVRYDIEDPCSLAIESDIC